MKRKDYASSYGVIGLGRFGMALVECLSSAGKEVIAIDKEESRVREARRFTEMALVVENLDQEALEEAGIRNCDVVVVCIGERIDVSILVTMTVLKMGIAHVISKATSFIHGEALKQLGASVVFPERDMAIRLGKGLIYDSFLDSLALGGDAEVRRILVTKKLIGTSIQDMNIRHRYGVNIIAIEHDGHTNVNFNADYFFREGDAICIVGQSKNVEYFEKDIH
jgi:trk system potassium uptake protein TrkA